jgi:hypothetical protein
LITRVSVIKGENKSEAVNGKRFQLARKFLEKQISAPLTFVRAGKAEGNAETQIFLTRPGGKEEYPLRIFAIKNKSICFACCDTAEMPKNLVAKPKKNYQRKLWI